MINLAKALGDIQKRLVTLAHSEEDWNENSRQLEEDNTRLRNTLKTLTTLNAELHRKATTHKPELENAIEARDASFRKLHHARKVIKDLIEEREGMLANPGRGSPTPSSGTFYSPRQSLYSPAPTVSSSRSTSVASNRTARSTIDQKVIEVRQGSVLRGRSPSEPASPRGSPHPHTSSPLSGRSEIPQQGSPRPQSATSTVNLSLQSPQTETQVKWSILYLRPPRIANVNHGPMNWVDLANGLNLNEDTVRRLIYIGILVISADINAGVDTAEASSRLGTAD
ncbi:hypothetical protein AMATHDRAFT_59079 [Amanita thiersii Skay4041]|uniref:Uncharacterized protein n=1 Tax=Amanita thiersii Skay4041 TaxID=703135 RepID=A0A2A9NSV0_9AGAR|nr:hypothetical protein AMATHDRAFT_59079 [Amanita thiersii Skay4041]